MTRSVALTRVALASLLASASCSGPQDPGNQNRIIAVADASTPGDDAGPCPAGQVSCGGCNGQSPYCAWGCPLACAMTLDEASSDVWIGDDAAVDGAALVDTAGTEASADSTSSFDGAATPCGVATCPPDYVCVQQVGGGGPVASCGALDEAGACPSGLSYTSSCPATVGGADGGPGCLPTTTTTGLCIARPPSCGASLSCACLAGVCATGTSCFMLGSAVQCAAE
ncbi:MAG: hypothetical protein ABTD50_00065 [Polyangiaceae bacterium]